MVYNQIKFQIDRLMQKQNRNNSNSQSMKKEKTKPEWSTDFVDREQYKLSEVQRIQKKASLQSKNREEARRQLEQRRKKLELGIIDEQTKKIYQTALVSKNIDVNPPLRKNLTEMIKYEKQQRQKTIYENQKYNDQENEEDQNEDQQRKELREAQDFIKKFEKAKKQQKIERAVEILNSNQPLEKQLRTIKAKEPETKINNFLTNYYQSNSGKNKSTTNDQKRSNISNIQSQDEAISSIEDTIRFMEEKLFLAKKTVDEHSKSFISNSNQSFENQNYPNQFQDKFTRISSMPKSIKSERPNQQLLDFKLYSQQNLGSFEDLEFGNKIGEISQLKINLKNFDEASSDDECLETIRRMRQILENKLSDQENHENRRMKQNIQDNFISPNAGILGFHSTISKKSQQFGTDSEAEVSFNLTLNDDQFQQDLLRPNNNQNTFKKKQTNSNRNQFLNKLEIRDDQNKKRETEKEERYQNQYKNIKQNLFSCINQEPFSCFSKFNEEQKNINVELSSGNFIPDSDDGQNSEDSLMIQNKINMWRKEFQHQADGQDNEEKEKLPSFQTIQENLPKRTDFISYSDQKKQSNLCNKHYQKHNPHRERQLIQNNESSDAFKNDSFTQNIYCKTKNRQNESYNLKTNENTTNKTTIKKPPLAKKIQNNDKFQEMKRMISNASTSIKKLEIEPLKIESLGSKEVMGFDFRGSINIKKNIK